MPNNQMFKIVSLLFIASSLIACQTTQTTVPKPEVLPGSNNEQLDKTGSGPDDPQQTLYDQAIKSSRDGKVDKAISEFTQLIKNNPATKRAYTNLGLLHIHKKQTEQAKEAFLIAIKQDKNDAIAYNHLAVIQRQQGEFKLALFNYYKAINAKPDYANARLNLGILLDVYMQDLPKALEQYEIYQQLTDNKNEQVNKWIIDISRRIKADQGDSK